VAARATCHDACVSFNERLLARMGMSAQQIQALATGTGPIALEETEAELLAFVRKALEAPESIGEPDLESLRRSGWSDGDVLDAVAHGASLLASSALQKAFIRP
jgi:hypothetical protein